MAYEEHGDRSPEAGGPSLAGYQVYDQHYEKIGKVDDLFVDESDRPEYIGVKTGLLGTKTTLIPIEIVRVNDKRELVEVAADKDVVKEGPTFGDDREITPEFERRVLNYYQVESAQTSAERGAYGAYYSDATGDDDRVDLRPGERAGSHERSGERRSGAMVGGEDRDRGDFREREESRRRPASREHERDAERGRDPGDGEELRIQRSEEELRAETRARQAGGMNVRKRVRTERAQVRVPKKREEVHLERVPVEEREASQVEGRGEGSGAEIGEDEIRIPVIEEEVVVEKRPVVREEIACARRSSRKRR